MEIMSNLILVFKLKCYLYRAIKSNHHISINYYLIITHILTLVVMLKVHMLMCLIYDFDNDYEIYHISCIIE